MGKRARAVKAALDGAAPDIHHACMEAMRCAIFVDFDNLVSTLRDEAGPEIARRFAERPQAWLAWLGEGSGRRHLVRRCYMNPSGFIEDDAGIRVRFTEFRRNFMAAGFEVIDCPRLTRLKNAADLRMALDCLDALSGPAPISEFTLLSSDSDFLPILLRLRAHDRLTRMVAHPLVSGALRGAADEVIGLDALAAELGWSAENEGFHVADMPQAIRDAVRDIVAEAGAPVHLPLLGKLITERLGVSLRESDYGGLGSLEALTRSLGLVRIEGGGGGYLAMPEATATT